MNIKKSAVLLLLLAAIPASAQSFEEYKRKALAEFNDYKSEQQREFKEYRDKVNKEFADFMRNAWEKFGGEDAMPVPTIDEPVVPPVVLPEEDRDKKPEDRPVPIEELIPTPEPSPAPEPIAPIETPPQPEVKRLSFTFYGTPCRVRFDVSKRLILQDTGEDAVASMWEAMTDSSYDDLISDCLSLRKDMSLCDWAYYELSLQLAKEIYGSSHDAEAVLLQSFVLTQSGFKIHIGRADDRSLHMLIAADCDLFNFSYWNIDGAKYYLLDGSGVQSLYIFTQTFPEEKPMRLTIGAENRFADSPTERRTLQSKRYGEAAVSLTSNKNLIDFYDSYPVAYANSDPLTKWRFYADTPLSRSVKNQIYPTLSAVIAGKSEADAANILVNFVQTAFVYKLDDEVWGRDRAFFADETLYYPYCDCEDRAILFSTLVRDLMHLDVVLVYYPGHLATAVRFNENVSGDYLVVNGQKYLVCDPTYINASIGMTMPKMDNSGAKVVLL